MAVPIPRRAAPTANPVKPPDTMTAPMPTACTHKDEDRLTLDEKRDHERETAEAYARTPARAARGPDHRGHIVDATRCLPRCLSST